MCKIGLTSYTYYNWKYLINFGQQLKKDVLYNLNFKIFQNTFFIFIFD